MRHLSQSQIPLEQRLPHLNRYKKQLREALLNPSLTEKERDSVKKKLAALVAKSVTTG